MTSFLELAYRRVRFGRTVIVVSGLPRTGTSMAMQMLDAGGLEILADGQREADTNNPKGYYELARVKDLAESDPSWLAEARGKAVKIIAFLLKYLPQTLNYKILFMHRDLHEVVASQRKMLAQLGESNDTDDDRMLELLQQHLRKTKQLISHHPCFQALDVDYNRVLTDPAESATRINRFLGGRLNVDRMLGVVDPTLYRNHR